MKEGLKKGETVQKNFDYDFNKFKIGSFLVPLLNNKIAKLHN